MGNPAKFDRCVKKVKGKSRGRVNAYAVCTAAGTRNPSAQRYNSDPFDGFDEKSFEESQEGRFGNLRGFSKRIGRGFPVTVLQKVRTRSLVRVDHFGESRYGWLNNEEIVTEQKFLKRFGYPPEGLVKKSNPDSSAADMYSSFHGAPSEEVLEFRESEHYHGNLAALGILVELKLVTITGYDVTLTFSDPEALVTANPGLWDRIKGIGSKSTHYHIATHPDKVTGGVKWRGFTIYKHKEGWYRIKELDPRLSFDSLVDARLFIDETGPVKKRNPDSYADTAYGNQYEQRNGKWFVRWSFRSPNFPRAGGVKGQDFSPWAKADKDTSASIERMLKTGRVVKTNPGPVQTSFKYLSKAGTAALKPFDSTFGDMGRYLDNKAGRALKNPSIFDYEAAARAGAERARGLGVGPKAKETIEQEFDIWWRNGGQEEAEPKDKTGNKRAYVNAFTGRKRRNPGTSLDPALLTSNESGTQLYITGGDQSITLKSIHMDTVPVKDSMVLGEAYFVSYFTTKDFDNHAPTVYEHDLSEETDPPSPRYKKDEVHTAASRSLVGQGTGIYPTVRYDNLNRRLYLDGGNYFIKKPFFETSPGIQD